MNIDVVGAGSLGLLFGGKLQKAGIGVRFWTRTLEQAEQLQHKGIMITERSGEVYIEPEAVQARPVSELAEVWRETPGDWMLLTVKQTHVHDFIDQIRSLKDLSEQHYLKIACYQNGIGHLDKLQAALPGCLLCSAITTEGVKREAFRVQRAGEGETRLGLSVTSVKREGPTDEEQTIFTLARLMKQAGFDCTVSNEIDKLIYRKLLINAVINPLTAIWRIPNGELLQRIDRLNMMRQLYDEALGVYEAMGVQMDEDLWEQVKGVCRSTASNTSSMLADVLHKRTTEVESINGSIVNMAKQFNLNVSAHETLLHLIQGMPSEGVS
ncbi:ketopantoate reductase family protein [Paenibacillus barcinonensis]|uniref:2-dehydropantoate 2-reductase n=1 Tax=Paenibacillus barcinonensis TaxID=198119 RepID=A0A2V4VLV5_PAEBA|nr:ketopantoate reductase family protein [Paenibacillus barcinonensis]PYE45760.1 2-dehydropantoate 2-reductase [Paenibacillus barcinonensis]QKS56327.1 ketopantoate reductase family protein [Paenibacillus barcinonensis]